MRQKYTAIIASILIITSAAVSVITPAVVNAANNIAFKTPLDELKSYNYYQAMLSCTENHRRASGGGSPPSTGGPSTNTFSSTNITNGEWFNDGSADVGYAVDDTDGKLECNTIPGIIKDLWGFSGFTDAAKSLGFEQHGQTWSSPDVNTIGGKIRYFVYNDNHPEPGFGSWLKYTALMKTFLSSNACSAVMQKKGHLTADQKADPSYVEITQVADDNKSSGPVVYKMDNPSKNTSVGYLPKSGGGGAVNHLLCSKIASDLNSNLAKSYISKLPGAYANVPPASSSNSGGDSGSGDAGTDTSSCNIDGVGWIICPVLTFVSKIVDQSYNVVSGMLDVKAFTSTSADSTQLKTAWSNMRNIANIAFVLAFLIIIYSQITGVGVSNYGIKKLLPRIIVAAILVNVSYWLCAVAVDLSNLAGDSMNSLIKGADGQSFTSVTNDAAGDWATGKGWEGITGGVLAGTVLTGAAIYVTLAALLPALVAVLIAIVTVLLVLTLRQALIILLIVVSPLAFVAFLLPNTQTWFNKWKDLFVTLLLMYPIIGAVFGASALASNIVMNSAGGGSGAGDEGAKVAIQIMGASISILPLAITPVIMKTAGGVLNRFAGMVNNPNKGPGDKLRKKAEGYRDRRQNIAKGSRLNGTNAFKERGRKWRGSDSRLKRKLGGGLIGASSVGVVGTKMAQKQADTAQKDKYAKIGAEASERNYNAKNVIGDGSQEGIEDARKRATKIASGNEGMATLVQAYGKQEVRAEDKKDIDAERSLLEFETNMDRLNTVLEDSSNRPRAAAAAAEIATRGSGQDAQQALDNSAKIEDSETRRLVQQQLIGNMKSEQFGLGQGDKSALSAGEYGRETNSDGKNVYDGSSYNQKINARAENKLSGEAIANLQPHDVEKLQQLAHLPQSQGGLSDVAIQSVASAIASARSNPNTNARIKDQAQKSYDDIINQVAARGITAPSAPSDAPQQSPSQPQAQPAQAVKLEVSQSPQQPPAQAVPEIKIELPREPYQPRGPQNDVQQNRNDGGNFNGPR